MNTKSIGDKTVPTRSLDAISRRNPDGTISVLHMNNEEYFLNIHGPATEAWSLIDGETSVGKIRATVAAKFKVSEKEVDGPLTAFLERLFKEKVLE